LLGLYLLLLSAGALGRPSAAIVCGIILGAAGGGAMTVLWRSPVKHAVPLPHPAVVAAALLGLPAAACGTEFLESWSAPIVGPALILAFLLVGSESRVAPRGGARDDVWTSSDKDDIRGLLRVLPTDVLLDEWRVTQRQIVADAGLNQREFGVRELLVDEFQCRDPQGTQRWLEEGPGRPSDGYIR
jgi:hypothetical protein